MGLGRAPQLTAEQEAEICVLYQAGAAPAALAPAGGLSASGIRGLLARHQIPTRHRQPPPLRVDDPTVIAQFWAQVEQSSGCWEWRGEGQAGRYGPFRINGQRAAARRVAYELTHGPIPPGRTLAARNKKCGVAARVSASVLLRLWQQQAGHCFYTGRPMSVAPQVYQARDTDRVSVDRIDNRQGSTAENIVLCTWWANGYLLVECDPQFGIHRLVKAIKGRSPFLLRSEFPQLKRRLPSLWSNSYFVSTVGGAPRAIIKQYSGQQKYV